MTSFMDFMGWIRWNEHPNHLLIIITTASNFLTRFQLVYSYEQGTDLTYSSGHVLTSS